MITAVRICTKGKIIILRINLSIIWLMLVKTRSLTPWLLSGPVVAELLAIYITHSDDGITEDGPTIVANKGHWAVTQYEVVITQPD
jgi:hypothetical protein